MAKLKISTVPNSILHQKSKPVRRIDKKIKKLAGKMIGLIKTGLEGERLGVGLSAIQVGKPIRLFVAYDKQVRKDLIFINPKIIWKSKKQSAVFRTPKINTKVAFRSQAT